MRVLSTPSEVIDALGGTGAVSRLTERVPGAVSNWRSIGRFSSETFLIFQQALREVGCTAPASLWGIKEPSEIEAA